MTLVLALAIFAAGSVFGFIMTAVLVASGQATEKDTIYRLRHELEELKGEHNDERET